MGYTINVASRKLPEDIVRSDADHVVQTVQDSVSSHRRPVRVSIVHHVGAFRRVEDYGSLLKLRAVIILRHGSSSEPLDQEGISIVVSTGRLT